MSHFKTIWEQHAQNDPALKKAVDWIPQLTADIPTLKAQAIETREPLDAFGLYLAELMGGTFELADNKSDESIAHHAELMQQHPHHPFTPDKRCDYVRGVLLLDSPDDVRRARKILRAITDEGEHETPLGAIKRVNDRYYITARSGFAGIFLTAEMPNAHLCEIQIHDRTYWNMVENTHESYKAYQAKRRSMSAEEWEDKENAALAERSDVLLNILIESGASVLHSVSSPDDDCSWPMRTSYDNTTENTVHFIARRDFA